MNQELFLDAMKHSPIRNYAGIPGLTSWLIGAPSSKGCVRLFECSRDQVEAITPHSHRFNLHCLVLAGQVKNVIWTEMLHANNFDHYQATRMFYQGSVGEYERGSSEVGAYSTTTRVYQAGDTYTMLAEEIHSIYFGRGTKVLFLEGPQQYDASTILEPFVDGEVVPTFKVEPWMFAQEEA